MFEATVGDFVGRWSMMRILFVESRIFIASLLPRKLRREFCACQACVLYNAGLQRVALSQFLRAVAFFDWTRVAFVKFRWWRSHRCLSAYLWFSVGWFILVWYSGSSLGFEHPWASDEVVGRSIMLLPSVYCALTQCRSDFYITLLPH